MNRPAIPETRAYGDFASLEKLKSSVHRDDPTAIRQVARQFESLFARMMIKSMRDAIGRDPVFGSDQAQMYQGMFDDQLSLELTRGHGLGLADMLVRQLQHAGSASAAAASPPTAANGASNGAANGASSGAQASFIREVWPQATQAAQQLGVHPVNLVAQAALETNWGLNMPQDARGRASNNLFGVKTGAAWSGPRVTADTQEFQNGASVGTTATFRAYGSAAQSFHDYVALLRGNPRYAAALNTGGDVQAFAGALQRAGYATDPDYARKVTAVAGSIRNVLASAPASLSGGLKFASAVPITSHTDAL
ncbi:MAG TPA: glucosaminidase domain-containing protein [Steroidobacteraceae bacterium]|nr:glucosaminidase domain-containing protein [Steroidobacteraceae bacterium]